MENYKNVRIKNIKDATVNEILSADVCLIDNDKGVVIFYDR